MLTNFHTSQYHVWCKSIQGFRIGLYRQTGGQRQRNKYGNCNRHIAGARIQ